MDVESSSKHEDKHLMETTPKTKKMKKNKKCICISVTAVILALGLLFLILGLTVFKAKRPVIVVKSVALSDLDFSVDIARLRVLLNLTLDTVVSVKNPNRAGFKYKNSTAILRYRGNDVGEVPLPAGEIGARDTRLMNLTLTLMADRLLSNSAVYSDVISGTLPFQTYIRMAGKVRILFVTIHAVAYSTCDLQIDLANRAVADQKCHYRTKL